MSKKRKLSRASFYLPVEMLEAMRNLKTKELINQSHQVELALRAFFEKKGITFASAK